MVRDLEEELSYSGKETLFRDKSELAEIFNNLDNDTQDNRTKMSAIDFNAKLSPFEIKNIMIVDEFIRLELLPSDTGICRQTKRLSRSNLGFGSEQKVRIAQGDRSLRAEAGSKLSTGNIFSRRPKNEG